MFFFLFSCSGKELPENYTKKTVKLKNNLGELIIYLPPEFDTLYRWTNISDDKCDDFEMIRFADNDYSLTEESGFINHADVDSLYQLTIYQPRFTECKNKDINIDRDFLEILFSKQKMINVATKFEIKEVRSFADRNYTVLAFRNRKNDATNSIIEARTILAGQLITLKFHCRARNCDQFISRMKKSLETVEIHQNH